MVINIIFTFILSYFLISISKEDIKTLHIGEIKLRCFTLFGFLYLLCLSLSNKKLNSIDLIKNNLISMLVIFVLLISISYLSSKLFRINSLGLGDIKLSSLSSIWLGIEMSFISLCFAFFLSAIYSLHGKLIKKFKPFHQYAFGPFLSIGIISSWILDKI